jgi:hypothetical protein
VALAVVGAALVLTSGATLVLGKQPDPARSAPVDLSAPLGLSWDDLHQWCVDRQRAGTDGLSNAGKLWLKGCADATSPTDVPSSPTTPPTSAPPATTPPTSAPPSTPTGTPSTPSTPSAPTVPAGSMNPAWFPAAAGNTGVPAGIALSNYTGPCTITAAGTTITGKIINCRVFINATGVTISNSIINGGLSNTGSGTVTITRSVLDGAANTPGADTSLPALGYHGIVGRGLELKGGQHSLQCDGSCDVRDSWLHAQSNPAGMGYHNNGFISNGGRGITLVHNRIECNSTYDNNGGGGCTADASIFGDFGPNSNYLIDSNLFMANASPYCLYGGSTAKAYPSPTNIVVTNNVFQKNWPAGTPHQSNSVGCGYYGVVTDFSRTQPGNVWSGNVWDVGGLVNP